MPCKSPERTRVYVDFHHDSRRWDRYNPRAGDVIISTASKSGTTWMQRILSLLVFGLGDLPDALMRISPCLDQWFQGELGEEIARVDEQKHRRFLKSHIPLDGLPYFPEVLYVNVGRDPRDVFMSAWNHYRSYTDAMLERLAGGPSGQALPSCPEDVREFWKLWMTTGIHPWEEDGYPFGSPFAHASSFWEHRHVPNILMVHYNDMKADLEHEMRRVAAFCGIDAPEEGWPALVEGARFDTMKRDASKLVPGTARAFTAGVDSFIYEGTGGRWRSVLSEADLSLYEESAQRLDPALRAWLEGGRRGAGTNPEKI